MAKSWLEVPAASHFSLANIPFGVISTALEDLPRPAVAIGEYALDLKVFSENRGFDGLPSMHGHLSVFCESTLNAFAALGRPIHRQVRGYLQRVFAADTEFPEVLKENTELRRNSLIPLAQANNHLPLRIGDYTDFFVGKNHAYNCGVLFRGAANALQPNYMHLPVGYHGRASSIVVSGTPIRRPNGQILEDPTAAIKSPVLRPCRCLDMELELGAFVCKPNEMGTPIPISQAEDHLFGLVLLNDWSARDIQSWESVPLGPFNAKNFGTTISPWVVLMDALEPFLCVGLENKTRLLPYLQEQRKANVYDLHLEIDVTAFTGEKATIAKTNGKNVLFSFPQMLAHHSIGGCPMQVGDLLGSGTVSGTQPGSQGCLLEQSRGGKVPIKVGNAERVFLEDGDAVSLRGWAGMDGGLVGFGPCIGHIEPAISM